MSLAGCQINLIGVNFYLQKSLEFFGKNSADEIQSKNYLQKKYYKKEAKCTRVA